jgi:hypothetical protein
LVPAYANRLRSVRRPFALYLSVFVLANAYSVATIVKATSRLAESYLTAASSIRPGATLVRLRYGYSGLPAHWGYQDTRREPATHLDAFLAAQCRCIDLSDFQAPSGVFPVVFNDGFNDDQKSDLWTGMENAGFTGSQTLSRLRATLPVPIDYVIVLGDAPPEAIGPDFSKATAMLSDQMRLAGSAPFVRIYERTETR